MKLFGRRTAFVNEGTDRRIEGPLGEVLARFQRQSLRYSTEPPEKTVHREGEWGQFTVYNPFFLSVFLKRIDGNYHSFRAGWRFDPNIGDGNNPKEPKHDPPGGYFLDVIVKPTIDHIVGN